MQTPQTRCACIMKHKPKLADYKEGDKWMCPDCNSVWVRKDVVINGKTYTWEKVL